MTPDSNQIDKAQEQQDTLQVVKPSMANLLMTPLKEIQEEPSGADLTSTSFNGGKKKKKKKKKKMNGQDMTIMGEYDEAGAGEALKSQRSSKTPPYMENGQVLERQRSRSAAMTPAERPEDSEFYAVPSPIKGIQIDVPQQEQQNNVYFGRSQENEEEVNLRMNSQ